MSNLAETITMARTPAAATYSVPATPASQAHVPIKGAGSSLAEIVSALSFALDLTEDARPGHAVRTCLLGMRIAGELGMPERELSSLYYALLLKDLGGSCNANLMCEMAGNDEPTFKRKVKLADWRYPTPSNFQMLSEYTGRGEQDKGRRVRRLTLRGRSFRRELARLHSERGVKMARKLGLDQSSIAAIASIDEHWNGCGYPHGLRCREIPLLARILNLAQCLDLSASESGTERAIQLVRSRKRSWFDPELVLVAESLAERGRLWQQYGSGMERKVVLDLEPGTMALASEERIDEIAEAFAEVVDAKSQFTRGHSLGVRDAAMCIADELGLSPEQTRVVRRAALLHDLGKLRVPNVILDKPGELDVIEWQVVREHPGLSGEILGRIRSFKEVARVVAEHHERLDGSGYPAGLSGDLMSIESRMVAVAEVYSALLEERSYRAAMSPERAMATMAALTPKKLDSECCAALFDSVSDRPVEAARPTLLQGICTAERTA
jgi:putative nucleotidyltransferase with HDIG domain